MKDRRQSPKILAFVMAGGQGSRLDPLTANRCKPAVPFGARFRIIDFVLSNLINSGIRTIYLLVQYNSHSLIEYIRKAWTISPLLPDQFVTVLPPQMQKGGEHFLGTADAVFQNINLIEEHRPDLVLVFGADHIYRMDIRQMVRFHQQRQADVSISALKIPLEYAHNFGVIKADKDQRIKIFQEKPDFPEPLADDPRHAFVSMGNYLFNVDMLKRALQDTHEHHETDFGHHVLPRLVNSHKLFAYDYTANEIPGVMDFEESHYWRDIGNIDAYFAAHHDLLGEQPKFELFNPQWPIFSNHYQGPVAKVIGGDISNSLLGGATIIHANSKISNSIIRRESVIDEHAQLEDCLIMDYVHIGRGARLRRVIVDRHNSIAPGDIIGFNHEADKKRFHVTSSGIVVVNRGDSSFFARDGHNKGAGYAE